MMVSVLFANERTLVGEKRSEVTPPVPFPVKMPPRVVEPVPPKEVERVVVPMTEPEEFANRSEEAIEVIARLVVVACCSEELPRTVKVPFALRAPETLSKLAIVVEPVRYEVPVVVAPPLIVRPPACVPFPIVEEANE